MPRVSVVMAIWDGDSIPFFKLALTSLKNQRGNRFETMQTREEKARPK